MARDQKLDQRLQEHGPDADHWPRRPDGARRRPVVHPRSRAHTTGWPRPRERAATSQGCERPPTVLAACSRYDTHVAYLYVWDASAAVAKTDADLRKLHISELREKLISYGVPEAEVMSLPRWCVAAVKSDRFRRAMMLKWSARTGPGRMMIQDGRRASAVHLELDCPGRHGV